MIVALSTSSPLASVALLREDGEVLAQAEELAPRAAGGACLYALERMLGSLSLGLGDCTLFVADIGPGGFTGVRVAVTLAKTLAFALDRPVAGATSFDLIAPDAEVAVSAKKGEYIVRSASGHVCRTPDLPEAVAQGYGEAFHEPSYPKAKNVARILDRLRPMAPELLLPLYVAPPSISTPKVPFQAAPGVPQLE